MKKKGCKKQNCKCKCNSPKTKNFEFKFQDTLDLFKTQYQNMRQEYYTGLKDMIIKDKDLYTFL